MLDKLLPTIATALLPLVGLLIRASRRNRLRRKVDEYYELAEKFRARDAALASRFEELATEIGHQLAGHEGRRLHRRFEPTALVATVFFVAPGVGAIIWSSSWDSSWSWVVVVLGAMWALIWGAAGVTQLWRDASDESSAEKK